MNNYYWDESIAEYVLNSPHPELITVYGDDKPIGSICLKDDDLCLRTQDIPQWALLATINSEPEVRYLKPELAVCECCGAPLKGNKCEYCGSTYIWR